MSLNLATCSLFGEPLNELFSVSPSDTLEELLSKAKKVAELIEARSGVSPFIEDTSPYEFECTYRGLLVFFAKFFETDQMSMRSFRASISFHNLKDHSEWGLLSIDPKLPENFSKKDLTVLFDEHQISWQLGDSSDLVMIVKDQIKIAIAFDRNNFQSIEIRKDFTRGI